MATIAGSVLVRITPANVPPPPPPAPGQPFVVATPDPVVIGPGNVSTITLRINDGSGNLSVPTGILVTFWPGTNNGIVAKVLAVDSVQFAVPVACPAGDLRFHFEYR